VVDDKIARREWIGAARSALLIAIKSLNTNSAPCDCCGLNKAENWAEAQMARELQAMCEKLAKFYASDVNNPSPTKE
jgi:hypothetical protein